VSYNIEGLDNKNFAVLSEWRNEYSSPTKFTVSFKKNTNAIQIAANQYLARDTSGAFLINRLPYAPFFYFLADRQPGTAANTDNQDTALEVHPTGGNAPAIIDLIKNSSKTKRDEFETEVGKILPNITIGALHHSAGGGKIIATEIEQQIIGADEMGSGVSQIAYLVALLTQYKDKIYIIEEPENNLHPAAIKALLNLIATKSASNQFFISTHSHIVLERLGSLPNSKVFETKISNDENPKTTVTELMDPNERKQALLRLGHSLSDFDLYDGFIITEESTGEAFLKNLIDKFIPQLSSRIKTIAASGATDTLNRYSLLAELYTYTYLDPLYKDTTWVILDGDIEGEKTYDKLKKNYQNVDFNKQFFLLGKLAIEYYYPDDILSNFLKENKIASLEALLAEKNIEKKRKLKTDLLTKVLKDATSTQLKNSAKEIIDFLLDIQL
jgi:hypothetical protein